MVQQQTFLWLHSLRYSKLYIIHFQQVCVRKTRIFGTKGELVGHGDGAFSVFTFNDRKKEMISPASRPNTSMTGHGGGDYFLMNDFITAIRKNDPTCLQATPLETLHSHLMVFAAEESRLTSTVVSMNHD